MITKYNGKKLFKYFKIEDKNLIYQTYCNKERITKTFLSHDCMLDYLQRVIIANLIRKIDCGSK